MSRNGKGRLYAHRAPANVEGQPPAWSGWAQIHGEQFRVFARYVEDEHGETVLALQIRRRKKPRSDGADSYPEQSVKTSGDITHDSTKVCRRNRVRA